jgi:hypothetical protein
MKKRPSYPLIEIADDWYIEIHPYTESALRRETTITDVYTEITTKKRICYDNNNEKWLYEIKTEEQFKNTWWNRLKYRWKYTSLQGEEIWTKVSDYCLDDLKAHLYICIDNDDDVLTQFVEADEFKAKIATGTSLIEVIKILGTNPVIHID